MSKPKVDVNPETITKAIQEGKLTSLTQVSKALGLGKGSVSGSVAKRLRELVPNVADLLVANKPAKDATPAAGGDAGEASGTKPEVARPAKDGGGKPKGKKAAKPTAVKRPAGKVGYPIPDCCPYPHRRSPPDG